MADRIRAAWLIPDGAINNLTILVESAGVIIIESDFGTNGIDGTSLWISETPPLIFINKDLPQDRYRFTLAHELGHLIMHDICGGLTYQSARRIQSYRHRAYDFLAGDLCLLFQCGH